MNDTPEPTNAEIVEKAREYQSLCAESDALLARLSETRNSFEEVKKKIDDSQKWFGTLTKDHGSVVVQMGDSALLIRAPVRGSYNPDTAYPEPIQVIS